MSLLWNEPEIDRQVKRRLRGYGGPWVFGYVSAFLDTWKPKTWRDFVDKYLDSGMDREVRIKKLPEGVRAILQNPDAPPSESRPLHYAHRDFNFMYGRTRSYFEKICDGGAAVDWLLWHGLSGAWAHYAGVRHGFDT